MRMKKIASKHTITVATIFTLLRIVLTPLVVYLVIINWWGSALVCFITAALTDGIDGFIARHYNQKTFLGACLDPVADKILLLSVFFTIWILNISVFSIPTWFVVVLYGKEFLQIIGAL